MINNLAINTIKIGGIAAVNKANSGHPGIVLGAAPMMHTLFTKHLVFDPRNPKWINRDRFVLSAGHGSALLYSQLRLLGMISTEDLMHFRQYESITPGHPEYGMTPGVEATTGPLGQGLAMAVGMAVSEESLRSRYKEINHYTYALVGDGDLQEGVAMEAMSFAGRQKLSKLIVLFDSNDIQLDTPVGDVFNESIKWKVKSMDWDYILVEKNEFNLIDKAIEKAKTNLKPTLIEIKTIIGEGSNKQGTSGVHGSPLGDDIKTVKEYLKWNHDDFFIPNEVKKLYQETIFKRGKKAFDNFKTSQELEKWINASPESININDVNIDKNVATRVSSGNVIQHLNETSKQWIGGSADLSGSTKASGPNGVFDVNNRTGRNILFGVREFAMASISNGIALHSNFRPFVSTFYVFTDYLKPALRLSAIMKLPIIYIMTHDSVFVGEDGPTHQPIEQNAMVRSIPNVNFIRPADEKEVIGAYNKALLTKDSPTVIVLTRQKIVSLENTSAKKILDGPYKILDNNSKWTLVASGSELASAFEIGKELNLNVVSISNWKGQVDWNIDKAITIEAATTFGMKMFGKYNIGIDTFGESAPSEKIYHHFGLDKNSLLVKIKKIINS